MPTNYKPITEQRCENVIDKIKDYLHRPNVIKPYHSDNKSEVITRTVSFRSGSNKNYYSFVIKRYPDGKFAGGFFSSRNYARVKPEKCIITEPEAEVLEQYFREV